MKRSVTIGVVGSAGLVLAAATAVGAGSDVRADTKGVWAPDDVRAIARELAQRDEALSPAVRNWYASPDRPLVWETPDSDASTALRDILTRASQEGLGEADIGSEAILLDLSRLDGRQADSTRAKAELALSTSFIALTTTYLRGSDTREELDVAWSIRRDSAPGIDVLSIASSRGPEAALDSVRPLLPLYDRTAQALASLRQRRDEGGGWPRIESGDVASAGDSMAVVEQVRARLGGSLVERERELAERGKDTPNLLDDDLAVAIAHFQRRHGIAVDSVIGPETVAAMNVSLDQRVEQLELNLDRIRWLPRDMGERAVLVNVAGFELRVLENNSPVMKMGVVVGRPSWRTAVFSDTIEHLIVNPYWHVPESIEAEEMLPRVREDPAYLSENRISVVPADDNYGDPVNAGSIDWGSVSSETMPYDFRQEPGPENSLGQIKFMFPNQHNIYLHDTPADELFQENFRAFSHGCIRVERPWDLARYILRTASDRSADELATLRSSRERTRLELSDPMPVYVAYLTSWVDEDGTISFHQDLYDRDEAALPGGTP